jgi:predicted dehydrogenase
VTAVYADAAVMLDREELDFIDIVTTAASHQPLVDLGATCCKLIVCQKPFAETLEDADAMVAACHRAQVPLLVHENFRWQRPFLTIGRRIRSGAIGQPHTLRLTFRHSYDIYRTQPYLAEVERLALMDVGLHLFDLTRVLMGEVRSLHCRTQHLNPSIRGEDAFAASLRHENGAVSVVDCSFFSPSSPDLFPQTLACIEGTEGSLELAPGYRLREVHFGTVDETSVEPEVPIWGAKPWHCIQESVISFQRHVVEVLEGRALPQPSGSHNRDTLALAFAAYDSAAQDRVIDMGGSGRFSA